MYMNMFGAVFRFNRTDALYWGGVSFQLTWCVCRGSVSFLPELIYLFENWLVGWVGNRICIPRPTNANLFPPLTRLDLQCFLGAFDIVFDEMILKCFTCYCFASFGRPLWLWSDGPAMEPYFFIIQCFVFLRCLTLGQILSRRETPALYIRTWS